MHKKLTMETKEIFAALKTNTLTKKCIADVLPFDLLPDKSTVKYNELGLQYFVVNLDSSDKPGSHWVAILVSPVHKIYNEYFDSYGLEPTAEIREYLGGNYLKQCRELQSSESTVCGQWCMYYVWLRCRGYTLRDIIKPFANSRREENDEYVNKIINAEFSSPSQPIFDREFISQVSHAK